MQVVPKRKMADGRDSLALPSLPPCWGGSIGAACVEVVAVHVRRVSMRLWCDASHDIPTGEGATSARTIGL